MAFSRPGRPHGRTAVLLLGVLLSLALAACETAPILRGSGSEHRQRVGVGLPF
jgi:ABC-type phosphate transport system permease subunit